MTQLLDIASTVLLRLLILALMAAGAAALTFAANWLRQKAAEAKATAFVNLSESQRAALNGAIDVAVQAAQQVLAANSDKYNYAKGIASQAAEALGIKITDAQLDALIESAVYELKQNAEFYKK